MQYEVSREAIERLESIERRGEPIPRPSDRFARRVFTAAWLWGVVSLVPLFFIEDTVANANGGAVSPPEYYYGFAGTALVFQAVFFLISRDPLRYRPLVLVAIAEKAAFAIPALLLWMAGRTQAGVLPFALVDSVLGALFIAAAVSLSRLCETRDACASNSSPQQASP